MHCECTADGLRMHCDVNALWMRCGCVVEALWKRCGSNVEAMWMFTVTSNSLSQCAQSEDLWLYCCVSVTCPVLRDVGIVYYRW